MALFLLIASGAAVAAVLLVSGLARTAGSPTLASLLAETAILAGALVATTVMLRWVDHAPWGAIGLGADDVGAGVVSFGVVVGAATIALPTGALLLARQYVLVPAPDGAWLAATLHTTVVLLPAALWEELVFRGYAFAVLRERIGWKWALGGTAFAFGLAHATNPGATAEAVVAVIIAGYFLGLVRLVTGSLYAAWGAHFAWNWVMACGFHVAVSGNPFERPDYQLLPRGPDWVTGGPWGPEGGAAAAVALVLAALALYGMYLKPGGAFRTYE